MFSKVRWFLFLSGVGLLGLALANHFGLAEKVPLIEFRHYKIIGGVGVLLMIVGYSVTESRSEQAYQGSSGDETPGLCEPKRDSFWDGGSDGGSSGE